MSKQPPMRYDLGQSGIAQTEEMLRSMAARITAPSPNPLLVNVEANYASEFHKRLCEWIQNFDASLDSSHEVGIRLVNFGQILVFHLEDMHYWNPSLISFLGHMENGEPVELIQRVTQISILLMTLPRNNASEPKRPIGFQRHNGPGAEEPTDQASDSGDSQ